MENGLEEKKLLTGNEVIINGKRLDDESATMLFEAINGHFKMGAQREDFMAEERGISVDEQLDLIHYIYELFKQ